MDFSVSAILPSRFFPYIFISAWAAVCQNGNLLPFLPLHDEFNAKFVSLIIKEFPNTFTALKGRYTNYIYEWMSLFQFYFAFPFQREFFSFFNREKKNTKKIWNK